MNKYIELLDSEIERLTGIEKQRNHVNMGVERELHILFENRRNAEEYMAQKQVEPDGISQPAGTPSFTPRY